jgi:hypothetical protein
MCWLARCDCLPVGVFLRFLDNLRQGQSPRLVCLFELFFL